MHINDRLEVIVDPVLIKYLINNLGFLDLGIVKAVGAQSLDAHLLTVLPRQRDTYKTFVIRTCLGSALSDPVVDLDLS